MTDVRLHVGVSGWGISSRYLADIPTGGSHLERYARVFSAVEITTSFYRHHQLATYERWARSVGPDFRFAVKTPQSLTHEGTLVADAEVLDRFAAELTGLGTKLRVVLVQLPPSLECAPVQAVELFSQLRGRLLPAVTLVCEPRHPSWNSPAADALLKDQAVSRVAADPARFIKDGAPGGDLHLAYYRLHGAPRIYFSDYTPQRLADLTDELRRAMRSSPEVWCVFDNTAHGHAIGNALWVQRAMEAS